MKNREHSFSRREANRFELVLLARNVPHRLFRLRPNEGGWTILVPETEIDRAILELESYIHENRPAPFRPLIDPGLPAITGVQSVILFMLFLLFAHATAIRAFPAFGIYAEDWYTMGSARAADILAGQWWRAGSALLLHADWAHVAGNAIIGGVFCWLCCRRLDTGPAWMAVIVGGVGGNIVNAFVLGPPHNSIGFSTAVFAAAGVLAASSPVAQWSQNVNQSLRPFVTRILIYLRDAFIPVAAGLGILAMLGSGDGQQGSNIDLGAHLFGFACGLCTGVLAALIKRPFSRIPSRMNILLTTTAQLIPLACFFKALLVWINA
jgi:membrane associated rhomboid family serine protease